MANFDDVSFTKMTFTEGSVPSTPATSNWTIYTKTDGLYIVDDAGTETGPFGTGGGGGGEAVTPTPDASDEFDNAAWGGTTVDPASPIPTVLEQNGHLSIKHPGGDAAAEMHGYMISFSPAGDFCVMAETRAFAVGAGFTAATMMGVIAADGTTHGSGNQMAAMIELNAKRFDLRRFTGYDTSAATDTGDSMVTVRNEPIHVALQYTSSSNLWKGYYSADGETWFAGSAVAELTSSAITTSHVGVAVSTWGSATAFAATFEHLRAYDGTLATNGFSII